MSQSRFVQVFTVGCGLASLAAGAASLSDDQRIAERFSPVIVNEERYSEKADMRPENQLDRVDKVFYDVSETEDYMFISYSVMKSWSANPERILRFGLIGEKTKHPVDSEDLSVVLRKDGKGGLHPVLYTTNRHGARLVYAVESEVDATELKALREKTEKDEADSDILKKITNGAANIFGASQAIEKTFDGKLAKANFVGGHPVVGSSFTTHSLVRSSLSKEALADEKLILYVSDYAADARKAAVEAGFVDKPYTEKEVEIDGVKKHVADQEAMKGDRVRQYNLVRYADLIPEMVAYVHSKGRLSDMNRCRVRKDGVNQVAQLQLRGDLRSFDAPILPSHVDYEWYFENHRKEMLPWYKKHEKKLFSQRADLFYSGHSGVLKTDKLCERLLPAESFCKALPETCRKHGVDPAKQPNYVRYDLIDKAVTEIETSMGLHPDAAPAADKEGASEAEAPKHPYVFSK